MDTLETTKLLALIKLAYPNSYRGMDNESAMATVNMWEMSFRDVPYQIMEQAFNSLRMKLKFPPTCADMAEEIRSLHYEVERMGDIQRNLGNHDGARRYYQLSDSISRFKNWPNMEAIHVTYPMLGGDNYAGTSGDRLDRAHRLPQLDAGVPGRRG